MSTQLVLGAAKTLCRANFIARPALSGRQLPPYILSFPPVGAHRLEVPVLARVPLGTCRLEAPILAWDLIREPEEKVSDSKNVQKCADIEENSWTFGLVRLLSSGYDFVHSVRTEFRAPQSAAI